MRVLTERQRRVLFAHERAHLRFGHHRFHLVAQVATAVNPTLLRAESAMAFLCERWADEYAAAEVGDRGLAARSVSAAALAAPTAAAAPVGPAGVPGFRDHEVVRRVRALLVPQPGLLRMAGLLAAVLAGSMIARTSTRPSTSPFLRTFPADLAASDGGPTIRWST